MQIVAAINKALTELFGLLLSPFAALPPIWPLLVISVLSGVLMLWIFGKVSNQPAIKRHKDRMQGFIIGIRVYRDDLRQLFLFQGKILGHLVIYLKHAVVPLLIILVPVIPILAQLNLHFAARPLPAGEPTILTATVRDAASLGDGFSLESTDTVEVQTVAVHAPSLREVSWRIRPLSDGIHVIRIQTPDGPIEKQIIAGDGWGAISSRRTGQGAWHSLLYPGETPLSGGDAIQSIVVRHPDLDFRLLGWSMHWMVVFILVSVLAGYAFRNALGVQI